MLSFSKFLQILKIDLQKLFFESNDLSVSPNRHIYIYGRIYNNSNDVAYIVSSAYVRVRQKQQYRTKDQYNAEMKELLVERLHIIVDTSALNTASVQVVLIRNCVIQCIIEISHDPKRIEKHDYTCS